MESGTERSSIRRARSCWEWFLSLLSWSFAIAKLRHGEARTESTDRIMSRPLHGAPPKAFGFSYERVTILFNRRM